MNLAPNVATRRVTGIALAGDGTPALGQVEFEFTITQLGAQDNVTLVGSTITATVDRNTGAWAVDVPITDQPALSPGIKVYAVRMPGARSVRTITVPTGSGNLRYVDAPDSVIVPPEMIGVALTGLTMGRVTTLDPGSLGTAKIVGGPPVPELQLGIPQGPKGDRPTVELGTVTTGAPGSAVQITWSGVGSVANPYKLNLTIPRGDKGDDSTVEGPPGPDGRGITRVENTADPHVARIVYSKGTPATSNLTLPTGDAAGINDTAPAADSVYSSQKVEQLLGPKSRLLGPLRDCVIIGSSNATPATWTGPFCAAWGLTERNHAVGGAGVQTFKAQLQDAAANSAFSNANVGLVVICDASNSIRAKNNIASQADATVAYAVTTFPNARIVFLPVIWPSDPASQATAVPGGYQRDWHEWLHLDCQAIADACRKYGAEFVDQSWTWITGHDEWMEGTGGTPNGGVHLNATGYAQVVYWLGRHLRGLSTRADTAWAAATRGSGVVAAANSRQLMARSEGWRVIVEGAVAKNATAGSGGYTDLATLPLGYRPTWLVDIPARYNGQASSRAATIYESGVIRLWENVPAGMQVSFSGSFPIG